MKLFSIDLFDKSVNLMKEAFKLKKYKAFSNKFLAIAIFIIMFPLVAVSVMIATSLFLVTFLLKIIQSPVDYLRSLVNNEGKEVKHATQFIIYLISWQFIFIYYIVISILRIYVFIIYALLSCVNYAWTLGGFKFHLFVDQTEDISIEVNGTYKLGIVVPFISIQGTLLILVPFIFGLVLYVKLYMSYHEHMFWYEFLPVVAQINLFSCIFSLFYSYLGLSKLPKTSFKED